LPPIEGKKPMPEADRQTISPPLRAVVANSLLALVIIGLLILDFYVWRADGWPRHFPVHHAGSLPY
jgi:hypothetical protein